MEFSNQSPEGSVRMLTLKTGGNPLKIGRLRCESRLMYPQTNREMSPPPPAHKGRRSCTLILALTP